MFHSLISPSSSSCPSPVRDLAATIKTVSSLRRQKYKSFIGSQEPMISKSRLTMTGGFTDFRPCHLDKSDSIESNNGNSSVLSSSRSDSFDSGDAIIPSHVNKHGYSFVKIPKKAFVSAVGHLSPKLSKKMTHKWQTDKAPEAPKSPLWPNVMTTYSRGVSMSPVQTMMMPLEPSLTSMKAQAILDERRDIRIALQMLIYKVSLQRQVEVNNTHMTCEEVEDRVNETSSDKENNVYVENPSEYSEIKKSLANQMQIDVPNLINPEIISTTEDRVETPENSRNVGFQDESLCDALDLDSVATVTPEDLVMSKVAEVCNIHLVCDYIILETGPRPESVFV